MSTSAFARSALSVFVHGLVLPLGVGLALAGRGAPAFAGVEAGAEAAAGQGAAKSTTVATPDPDAPTLRFQVGTGTPKPIPLAALVKACGEERIEVDDPYHGGPTRYRAIPFRCVLDQGFAERGGVASLAGESLLLRARDGYTRPASGKALDDPRAHLAFGEPGLEEPRSGAPRFRPIDRRQVDPAPFYLVWSGVARGDAHEHPWPYQLETIEIAPFEQAFPHTAPRGLPKSDASWRGYARFQSSCSACHAINGEGGTVGPELNVPKSIVEYRPIAQIRAYIRDPQATRYTNMPAHPDLDDRALDELIAYFRAMSERKHDPRAARPEGGP